MKGITTFIKHNQDKQTIINIFLDIKMSLLKLLVTVGILLAIAVCTANAITVSLTHAMILLHFKCACFILYSTHSCSSVVSFQLDVDLFPLMHLLETVHSIMMKNGVSTMGASMCAKHKRNSLCYYKISWC